VPLLSLLTPPTHLANPLCLLLTTNWSRTCSAAKLGYLLPFGHLLSVIGCLLTFQSKFCSFCVSLVLRFGPVLRELICVTGVAKTIRTCGHFNYIWAKIWRPFISKQLVTLRFIAGDFKQAIWSRRFEASDFKQAISSKRFQAGDFKQAISSRRFHAGTDRLWVNKKISPQQMACSSAKSPAWNR